jgi:hypothetical protein
MVVNSRVGDVVVDEFVGLDVEVDVDVDEVDGVRVEDM